MFSETLDWVGNPALMTSPSYANELAAFLPRFQLERLQSRSESLRSHCVDHHFGVVLFVDITGFSQLTEQLSKTGTEGAEQLAGILDEYFGKITEVIFEHGGDVLSYAGDAALGIWLTSSTSTLPTDVMQEITGKAARAGLAIQRQLKDYSAMPGLTLQQRVSIGAGSMHVSELGGVGERWKLLVTGEAIKQAGTANEFAMPGQVVLSPDSWDTIRHCCTGSMTEDGVYQLLEVSDSQETIQTAPPSADSSLASLIGGYLPPVVSDRVNAGQAEWLNEFRTISLAFIGLGEFDLSNEADLNQIQQATIATQEVARQYEGVFHRLLMDDKGTSLILCFGVPPYAHEDDGLRSVRASLELQQSLIGIGLTPSIGVTTGRAFCGACGGRKRRQYSIYGPVINLAARFMQNAKGRILCDENTVEEIGNNPRLGFSAQASISLKGIAEKVAVFEASSREESHSITNQASVTIGRLREREILDEVITGLVDEGTGRTVVLEGEAGIGKSHLLNYAMLRAEQLGAKAFTAVGDEIEKDTPLYAWRSLFRKALGLQGSLASVAEDRSRVLRSLEGFPEWQPVASLLNLVLPFDLPESETVGDMSEEARAESRQELLYTILAELNERQPIIVVIENAQWLDSSSWNLLKRLSRTGQFLLLVSMRPLENLDGDNHQQFADTDITRIQLGAMSSSEVNQLACQRLEVDSLPLAVSDLIVERGEGHPLFSEELAILLRDEGLVRIANGRCRLVADESESSRDLGQRLDDQGLPATVQGVILRRLDELPASLLLTVKVASTLGQSFPFAVLHKIYPVEIDADKLSADLDELVQRRILARDEDAAEQLYRFQQAITVEVAYESMLYAQRRELHQSIALWYEEAYSDELGQHYQVLARHWQRAESKSKAVEYLAKAGEQSLSSFANQEAVRFLSDALDLDMLCDDEVADFDHGITELRLGRALVNWSKYTEGRTHLEKGLAHIGEQTPNGLMVPVKFTGQVLKQMFHRLMPKRSVGRKADDARRLKEAARAYEALMEIYYTENATSKSLYACLRSLNLAESAGPSSELARSYGAMSALVGMVGMRRSAVRYGNRALDAARKVKDPAAEAWVSLASGVYLAGMGDWEKAVPLLQNAADISQRLNDRRRWTDSATHLAISGVMQGDFKGSLELANEIYDSSTRAADDQGRANSLLLRSDCLLRLNQLNEIPEITEELKLLAGEHSEVQCGLHILLASLHFQNDQLRLARVEAEKALDQLDKPLLFYDSQRQYASLAHVLLNLIELEPKGPVRSDLQTKTAKACRIARKHAKFFPVAQAFATLCEGRFHWAMGRKKQAFLSWQKSAEHARRHSLLFEEGRAHYRMAIHLDKSDQERSEHLSIAKTIFEKCHAAFDLRLIDKAIQAKQ